MDLKIGWNVFVRDHWTRNSVGILFVRNVGDGSVEVVEPMPDIWKSGKKLSSREELDEVLHRSDVQDSIILPSQLAHALIDELVRMFNYGEPRKSGSIEGELKATKYHLEDMRRQWLAQFVGYEKERPTIFSRILSTEEDGGGIR